MRSYLVGLVLLVIAAAAPTASYGQVTGFVEKIGFGKQYRPYGWTPVLVNLTSTIGDPAEYRIEVRQEDLDRDRVVFRRDIVLNPNKQEKFWVYFMAQPRGLPENDAGGLDKVLDVRLTTKGGKPLIKLGINDPVFSVDPPRAGFGAQRGRKLVLFVADPGGSSRPAVHEFDGAIGINEDVAPVPVTPFDLPENVAGYDAVDVVVWMDADANTLTTGGSRRLAALTDFVRGGGRLVVTQPGERFKVEPLADLLPINLKNAAGEWALESRDKPDLRPIAEVRDEFDPFPVGGLAGFHTQAFPEQAGNPEDPLVRLRSNQWRGWRDIQQRGPFKVAVGRLRDDAVGEEWIDWAGDGKDVSPWIARRALGFGSVTWVAQDLGHPAIAGRGSSGWPYVWDRVLGQRNTDMRVPAESSAPNTAMPRFVTEARARYDTSNAVDLGAAMLRGMEHEGRAGGLVFLAGVFFVGYWVVAGPVSYLVLAGKKRTELSWTIFAVSAMAATLLTVGVVRLVLRGDAEVHHVSLVRMTAAGKAPDGTPISRAVVDSRIGLYIPRDGPQKVRLLDNDKAALSYVTPFSIHPAHLAGTTEFPAYLEYEIPVRDNPLNEPVVVDIPYRSTLKKLQARWVGDLPGGIDVSLRGGTYEQNTPKLKRPEREKGTISGVLVNRTGTELAHVYFVFNFPPLFQGAPEFDLVLYKETWGKDEVIDLEKEFNGAARLGSLKNQARPGDPGRRSVQSTLTDWAQNFWYTGLRANAMSDQYDDSRSDYLRSLPMLSLFDRIAPLPNQKTSIQNFTSDRVEVLRRAAREFDVSDLVAAGQLVIFGEGGKPGAISGSPLPFPMEVQGERVTGTGTTFYQFVMPLGRADIPPPYSLPDDETAATQRSATTKPATQTPPAAPAAPPQTPVER